MLKRLVRTSSFRLALTYAAVTATTFLVLFAVVYLVATKALDRQLRQGIEAEYNDIVAEAKEANRGELAHEILERTTVNGLSFGYALKDSAGRRLAGSLLGVESVAGWQNLVLPHFPGTQDHDHEMLALGGFLPDGSFVAVGDDLQPTLAAQEVIVKSFAWASVLALALSVVPGLYVGRRFLRRVDIITATSNEIMSGRLRERIPVRNSGDEFDHLAENLNRMLDRIESLLENLNQLSGSIAHDLRTPLNRLHQTLEDARSRITEPVELEKAIDQALVDSESLQGTFAALLRISEIESKSRRAAFMPINLSATVANIVEVYSPVAESEGKMLTSKIAGGLEFIGDEELLVQMLANLVENAIKHTPPRTNLRVELKKENQCAVTEISDNGSGIPEKERKKVFERFYRLEQSRTTPGNGLGLALVAAIAELHSISVALEDNNPGLRVVMSFPDNEAHYYS